MGLINLGYWKIKETVTSVGHFELETMANIELWMFKYFQKTSNLKMCTLLYCNPPEIRNNSLLITVPKHFNLVKNARIIGFKLYLENYVD